MTGVNEADGVAGELTFRGTTGVDETDGVFGVEIGVTRFG